MEEKWRIMVVDDDDDTRRLLAATLGIKYEVVEASNGLDALTKLEDCEPDFIVMDVKMPLMNGFQACQSIRKNPKFGSIRVMFLSGLDDKEHIKKGYEVGGDLYLTKPIEPERLLKNVDLYFSVTPPLRQEKKLTLEQIKQLERTMAEAVAREKIQELETEADLGVELMAEAERLQPAPLIRRPLETYPPYERPRVMIVDDDPDIIGIIRATLEGTAEVVWATDSVAAIEKLARYEPDILLLDIMMPKFSGYQFLQTIRRNMLFKNMPVIVVSARSSPKDKQYALRMGANEYLTKPFSPAQLVKLVEYFIAQTGYRLRKKKLSYEAIMQIEIPPVAEGIEETEERKFLKKLEASELEEFIRKKMMDETDVE